MTLLSDRLWKTVCGQTLVYRNKQVEAPNEMTTMGHMGDQRTSKYTIIPLEHTCIYILTMHA